MSVTYKTRGNEKPRTQLKDYGDTFFRNNLTLGLDQVVPPSPLSSPKVTTSPCQRLPVMKDNNSPSFLTSSPTVLGSFLIHSINFSIFCYIYFSGNLRGKGMFITIGNISTLIRILSPPRSIELFSWILNRQRYDL